MRSFLLLSLAVLLAACDASGLDPEPASSQALGRALPDGLVYNELNRNYYAAVADGGITWSDANAAAEGMSYRQCDAHLAVVTSQDENDWIVQTFPEAVEGGYWLGGTQAPGETDPTAGWSWVTGETFLYTNWNAATGEPNDYNGTDEESLHFLPPAYANLGEPTGPQFGTWNDSNGDSVPFLFVNDEGDTEALVNGYVVEYECPTRLTGGGGAGGETFAFNAQKRADASVKGQAEMTWLGGVKIHLEVSCLSVWGNSAWAGGVTTRSNDPDLPVGTEFWWRTVDNGEGSGAENDAIGYFFYSPSSGIAQNCALQQDGDDFPNAGVLFEWEHGNLQVHG